MAKALEDFDGFSHFDDEFPEIPLEEADTSWLFNGPNPPKGHPRLDLDWMTARTAMFIVMTQGAGKPMTYGAQKKDKR